MARPLVAIDYRSGILYLSNFDTDTGYQLHNPLGLPSPSRRSSVTEGLVAGADLDGTPWYDSAERTLPLFCMGATAALAEEAVTALAVAASTPGARLLWQRSSTSRQIASDIYAASVTEDEVNLYHREDGKVAVTLSLTTAGEWYETTATTATASLTGPAATTTITGVRGDRPARTISTLLCGSASNAIALGIRSGAASDYDPIDAYSSCSYTLPATLPAAALAVTPPSIGVSGNRGACELFVRASGPVGDVLLRPASKTTGSGAFSSVSASTYGVPAVTTTSASQAWHRAGMAYVPSANLPEDTSGVSWAATTVVASSTACSGAVAVPVVTSGGHIFGQTISLSSKTRVTEIAVKGYTSSASGSVRLMLTPDVAWSTIGDMLLSEIAGVDVTLPSSTAAEVHGSVDVILEPGTYRLVVYAGAGGPLVSPYLVRDTAAGYAGGKGQFNIGAGWVDGDGIDSTIDWYFKVSGSVGIVTGSSVAVQAAYTTVAGTLTTTDIVRLPADEGCTAVGYAFGANDGMVIDESDGRGITRHYLTNASGDLAPMIPTWSTTRGMTRLRPGDNTLVVIGEGTISATVQYQPCYTTAAAGDV